MKHKTYMLSSRLPAETTIARIGELLAKEGVQYRTEGLSIFSIGTPIALLSLQRTLYSDRNWVGLNPFTFISGVRCEMPVGQARSYRNCRSSEQGSNISVGRVLGLEQRPSGIRLADTRERNPFHDRGQPSRMVGVSVLLGWILDKEGNYGLLKCLEHTWGLRA
jgi:hypothetical protein